MLWHGTWTWMLVVCGRGPIDHEPQRLLYDNKGILVLLVLSMAELSIQTCYNFKTTWVLWWCGVSWLIYLRWACNSIVGDPQPYGACSLVATLTTCFFIRIFDNNLKILKHDVTFHFLTFASALFWKATNSLWEFRNFDPSYFGGIGEFHHVWKLRNSPCGDDLPLNSIRHVASHGVLLLFWSRTENSGTDG